MKKILLSLLISQSLYAQEVEFLHWWTSTGEMAALEVMTDAVVSQGEQWKSTPIKGGGGDTAMAVLQARAIAGNPPTLAQIEGPAIKSWAKLGFLAPVDQIAQQENWDEVMLPATQKINQFNDHYVAVPITVHRVNWLWSNQNLLQQVNLPVPHTWGQFIHALKTLKANHIKPLALGNSPWQISMLFENIALGIGGKEYYQKALVELSPDALKSQKTIEILSVFRQIGDITKESLSKQRWDEATQELINNQAAFQILGDWVIGELIDQNATIPDYISCHVSPQTENSYIYNMDSFVIFKRYSNHDEAQVENLVRTLSSASFQEQFSLKKGSIPARADISMANFNTCSQQSRRDLYASEKTQSLLPSITDSMAVAPVIQNAITDELYRFFNNSDQQPEQLIARLIAVSSSRNTYK